ncbi:hypothetical protein [Chitinophaga barathri]|uniref:Uncharacterized protein n=1 Tax=Chitinophaga barathri TaxID=1647451 RepID=A0A3N4M9W2_9BACT|nr:hypothetical protein [Chitinophaga barathri]RPD40534.1 hypothetical protein EG028_14610 [Chitinophaga barathri]
MNNPIIEDQENLEQIIQQCISRLTGANSAITGVFITLHLKTIEIPYKGGLTPLLHTDTTVPATVFNNVIFILKPALPESA